MITEIIFSDYYRTFLLCILSIGVVFFYAKCKYKKKSTCISRIRIYCIFTFSLDIYCMHNFTEFDYESIIAIVQWELKWILYFTISIILQFAMYYFFWKKVKY